MIRVVLDTNVLVSALIRKGGHPDQILKRMDGFSLYLSESILEELNLVLHYPRIKSKRGLREEQIAAYLNALRDASFLTPGNLDVRVVLDDPADDKVIACALEAEADYIVTGDSHLKALESYREIAIVSPSQFLRILNTEQETQRADQPNGDSV